MSLNKILVTLNQSELSRKILPCVEKLFPADTNHLTLYFITRPPAMVGLGEPDLGAGYVQMPGDKPVRQTLHPIYATQQEDNIDAHVKSELAPVVSLLEGKGYTVAVKVGFNKDPIAAIQRYIVRHDIDLVAMSTRARVGMTRFFFRDMADTLAQKTDIPVLLVHPTEG